MEIDETFRLSDSDHQRMVTYIEDFGGTPHMLFLTELNRNKNMLIHPNCEFSNRFSIGL